MKLESLAGNPRAKAAIRLASARPSNAYVITGDEGLGKKTAAELLAAALVCGAGQGEEKPCGFCRHCKKAAAHSHPDIVTVYKEGKKSFLVDQARSVRSDAHIRPNEAERKVYLLPDASAMDAAPQNALLKVLEEPPPYAVFILICQSRESLLETVLSRVTEIKMEKVPPGEVQKLLAARFAGEDPEKLSAAAESSGGNIGRAIALLREPGEADAAAEKICGALLSGSELGLYSAFAEVAALPREETERVLALLCAALRDAVVKKTGGTSCEAPMLKSASLGLAGKYSLSRLVSVLTAAMGAYRNAALFLPGGSFHARCAAELYEAAANPGRL